MQRVLGRHYRSRLDIDLFPRKLFNSDSRDMVLRKLKNRGYGEKERERASRRVVIAATGYRRRRHANSHNVATRNHRRLFFFLFFLFFSIASVSWRGGVRGTRNGRSRVGGDEEEDDDSCKAGARIERDRKRNVESRREKKGEGQKARRNGGSNE